MSQPEQSSIADWGHPQADTHEREHDTGQTPHVTWDALTPCVRRLKSGEKVAPRPSRIDPSDYQSSNPVCRNCGARVVKSYARVAGDSDGMIHECPQCPNSTVGRRTSGAAAGLDLDRRGASHNNGGHI